MRASRLSTAIAAFSCAFGLTAACQPAAKPAEGTARPNETADATSPEANDASPDGASPLPTLPEPGKRPAASSTDPSPTECTTDGECVLTTFPGCCSCCPCATLTATSKADLAARERRCSEKECESCANVKVKCLPCVSPEREGMRARCIDRTCTLVETRAARVEVPCTSEDDCWLDDDHRPVARPRALRGKKLTPCKGTEHTPVCEGGMCGARHWKC